MFVRDLGGASLIRSPGVDQCVEIIVSLRPLHASLPRSLKATSPGGYRCIGYIYVMMVFGTTILCVSAHLGLIRVIAGSIVTRRELTGNAARAAMFAASHSCRFGI